MLAVLLVAAPLASYIPLATLAAVLFVHPRFLDRVGHENIMPNIQAALDRARDLNSGQTALAS